MDKKTKRVREELLAKPKKLKWSSDDLLSTGAAVLNCAISDSEKGGILPGEIIITVGASESGKTAWYNALLAEASMDSRFDDYTFYVDDSEGGNLFDIKRYWGKRLWKRVRAPKYKNGKEVYSKSLEDLEDTLKDLCALGKPFFFVEDSMDALMANQERKEYLAQRKARQTGKKEPGTYGSRPKKIRAILRHVRPLARELKAVIVLVFQETANFGFTGPAEKKTYAGGTAPKFFSNLLLWFNTRKSITKETGGVKKEIGTRMRVRIKKNRLTGKKCQVELDFFNGYGFDDVGSSVDFLVAAKHWKESEGKGIQAVEFGESLSRTKLIQYIEENNCEEELRTLVGQVWRDEEERNAIRRKPRYT